MENIKKISEFIRTLTPNGTDVYSTVINLDKNLKKSVFIGTLFVGIWI